MGVGGCYQPGVYVPLKALFLVLVCDCTGLIMSDLVGTPNCCFSHANAHFMCLECVSLLETQKGP